MEKCFNIAGPCFPDEHYMLPALERLPGIMRIVEQRSYAVSLAWSFTRGQPWLVNALARECVVKIHDSNYGEPITAEDISTAKEKIIRKNPVHIDYLFYMMRHPKVAPFRFMQNIGIVSIVHKSQMANVHK